MRHVQIDCQHRQTTRNDPRCTRVGSILRRTSLDELPQLWNVMRGDMSLVGPRPHADMLHTAESAACSVVAEYAQRQRVKPGLTGWAQINGARGAATTTEMLRRRVTYDLYYIDNWSIWFDVTIIIRTPWIMLRGNNAY
jgi:putative colanic acid biosynthesis UDP-glucose lipid carrier transferase